MEAIPELLKPIAAPGLNIYKQMEMWKEYRPIIPQKYWNNDRYVYPPAVVIDAVKREKRDRKWFKAKLNAKKLDVQNKVNIMAKVKKVAFEMDNV